MKWLRWVSLCAALLLACAGCTFGGGSGVAVHPTPSSSTGVQPLRIAPRCRADQLRADLVSGLGSGRDEYHFAVLVRARSSVVCSVQGTPVVTLAADADTPVGPRGVPARTVAIPAPTIVLGRGLAARTELVISEDTDVSARTCRARPVAGVLTRLSTSGQPMWSPFPAPVYALVPTTVCTAGGTPLVVRPFMPTS